MGRKFLMLWFRSLNYVQDVHDNDFTDNTRGRELQCFELA